MAWRGGRVVEGTSLLTRQSPKNSRGFESHPLRQVLHSAKIGIVSELNKQQPKRKRGEKTMAKRKKKPPKSYLDERRPPLLEAVQAEGDVPFPEAMRLLEEKGYFTPRPRPWQLGFRDRGHGHGDCAILDRFGDLVAEIPECVDARLIIEAVNTHKEWLEFMAGVLVMLREGVYLDELAQYVERHGKGRLNLEEHIKRESSLGAVSVTEKNGRKFVTSC